jgi:hypothetical protein
VFHQITSQLPTRCVSTDQALKLRYLSPPLFSSGASTASLLVHIGPLLSPAQSWLAYIIIDFISLRFTSNMTSLTIRLWLSLMMVFQLLGSVVAKINITYPTEGPTYPQGGPYFVQWLWSRYGCKSIRSGRTIPMVAG